METTETYRHIHFAVMAIESGSKRMGISGQEMESRLKRQGLIHKRLIGQYEMLHTQSLSYVTDDIVEALKNWETHTNLQTLSLFHGSHIAVKEPLAKTGRRNTCTSTTALPR